MICETNGHEPMTDPTVVELLQDIHRAVGRIDVAVKALTNGKDHSFIKHEMLAAIDYANPDTSCNSSHGSDASIQHEPRMLTPGGRAESSNDFIGDLSHPSRLSHPPEIQQSNSKLEAPVVDILGRGTVHGRVEGSTCSSNAQQSAFGHVRHFIKSKLFERFIGVIIILNCILIGIDVQLGLDGETSTFVEVMEFLFVLIYVGELVARFVALGSRVLFDSWVQFDAFLVLLACIDLVWKYFGEFMVIRIMRILRLFRALRMVQQFKTLWKLAYGLLTSAGAMLSTMLLVGAALFVFACLGISVITKDDALREDPEIDHLIETQFPSLLRSMLSLTQFVTLDGLADIYFPLIVAKPALILYFGPLILIVSISLMNLVTAIIVEGAFENARQDKEAVRHEMREKIKKLTPRLKEIFGELDLDKEGFISRNEILSFDVNRLPEDFRDLVDPESMAELFQMLDMDSSGDISEEEFVDGVLHLCMAEVPIEIVQILKLARMQNDKALLKEDMLLRKRDYKMLISQVFDQLTEDSGGIIGPREAQAFDASLLPIHLQKYLDKLSVTELFEMLDVDASGAVTKNEFVSGIMQLCLADVPIEVMQILKLVRLQHAKLSSKCLNI